jgi:RNA polymerase sigma factor (sigma-70 family)
MRMEPAEFGQIVERHQRAVYAVVFANVRDRALADDLTQDTFVKAWSRLHELRDADKLGPWLCGIARNLARDARRHQRYARVVDATGEVADPATPFDALSDAESEHLVVRALDAVPDTYREPLVLFYIEQQSVENVARALGISAATTNKRLSRGRQQLAVEIEALVERALTRRGPKRELVAGVLAAIALLGSSSHVDASPTKGSIMPKLVITTVLVAAVGTLTATRLLSAGPAKPAAPSASTKPAAPPATAAPARAPVATSPSSPPAPAAKGAVVRAPAAPALAPATPPPTCEVVARHMAEIQFAKFESAKGNLRGIRTKFITQRSQDYTAHCTEEKWSEDRRICAMGATDIEGARYACADDSSMGDPKEIAALPPELSCDAVAKHLAKLHLGPDGKLALMVAKFQKAGHPIDATELGTKWAEGQRQQCDDLAWTPKRRRCIVASTDVATSAACW